MGFLDSLKGMFGGNKNKSTDAAAGMSKPDSAVPPSGSADMGPAPTPPSPGATPDATPTPPSGGAATPPAPGAGNGPTKPAQ